MSEMQDPAQAPAPTWTPPAGPSGPRASFGHRLVAMLVDALVLGVPYVVLILALKGAGYAIAILLGIGYQVYLEGSPSGQTIGKKLLGIRVIDFNTGGPIGYGRAFLRLIGKFVSSFICYLGYFWMLWDKEKQTWHDKIATTVVVPVAQYPVSSWP